MPVKDPLIDESAWRLAEAQAVGKQISGAFWPVRPGEPPLGLHPERRCAGTDDMSIGEPGAIIGQEL